MEYREHREGNQGLSLTEDSNSRQLLEIYQLHAELADRVSKRREGANRLYLSLLSGIITLLAISIRFEAEGPMPTAIEIAGLSVGLLSSVSWMINIKSYKQLNDAKFDVLRNLEKKLDFQFFSDEWKLIDPNNRTSQYQELTKVERYLPRIFIALFAVLLVTCFTSLIVC